jgi:putative salt-induced outer membrane protein
LVPVNRVVPIAQDAFLVAWGAIMARAEQGEWNTHAYSDRVLTFVQLNPQGCRLLALPKSPCRDGAFSGSLGHRKEFTMKALTAILFAFGIFALAGCATSDGPQGPVEAAAPPAFEPTDKIHLQDGTVLVAEVLGLAEGKLAVKTRYAGEFTLDQGEVIGVTTTRPMNVRIKDSDRVLGTLTYDQAGQRVAGDAVPERPVSLERLDAIWALGADSPEEAARKAEIERKRPKWGTTLEAGVAGRTGNTERISSTALIEVTRETPEDRLKIYGRGVHSREEGEDSEKEFVGGASLEVDLSDRTYVFGLAEFENDIFEDISLRATGATGVGHFLLRDPGHELKVSGGVGVKHEEYYSGGDECTMIGLAGLEYERKIQDWLLLKHATTYEPSFEETRRYWVKSETSLTIPLNKDKNWKFKIGVRQHYTAVLAQDADRRLDTFYFANLVWDIQ